MYQTEIKQQAQRNTTPVTIDQSTRAFLHPLPSLKHRQNLFIFNTPEVFYNTGFNLVMIRNENIRLYSCRQLLREWCWNSWVMTLCAKVQRLKMFLGHKRPQTTMDLEVHWRGRKLEEQKQCLLEFRPPSRIGASRYCGKAEGEKKNPPKLLA